MGKLGIGILTLRIKAAQFFLGNIPYVANLDIEGKITRRPAYMDVWGNHGAACSNTSFLFRDFEKENPNAGTMEQADLN